MTRFKSMKSLAVLSLTCMFALAGCSGNNSNSQGNVSANKGTNASASQNTGDSGDTQSTDKAVWFSSVSFWTPPMTWSTDPNTVQGAITEKTGLAFDFNIPAQDADTKLSLMLVSSAALPDVMTITNDVLAKKLIQAGKVWDLQEFLTKYDPQSHLLTDFPADIKQVITERDGGWYAYPSHMGSEDARKQYPPSDPYYEDGVNYRSNGAIMVNEKLLNEAGLKLEDIQTEEGLLAAYKKIKEMDLKVDGAPVIPLQVDGKGYQDTTLADLQNMFGVMPVDKDGVYRDRLLAPETKHALSFLNQAMNAGYIESGQLTMDTTAVKSAVMSGRVFSFIGNTANTGFSDQDFWVSPGPILSSEGTKPVMGKSLKAGGGWMQTYIAKSTKYPEKIARWLSFMSSDEGLRLHYYGFEGSDYTLNEKGLVVQTDAGRQASADFAKTGVFAFWPFHHIAWHDSKTQAPTEKTGADGLTAMQVQTAFGKSPETVLYDNSPLSLPADFIASGSKLFNDQEQIKVYREAQISKIVMAKDQNAFNALYEELISKIKQLGMEAIDAKINEQVQKQAKDLGVTLTGVNS
ncbi:putative aldouronate transport system substrate-binding protein [Paenibacillus phyllosphaerae]|uniref:Putative aldouronate transport system substrate-binding protein n=1 Tax=Paenibacillus phyllosphaerae TaxID=274593 RepID=A0A7W5B2N9_9BACL|nr:hypothetical protein [Paenibacillus phyllosphaerae]MBB3113117.1 putative aldouronate transport system substrate-binding protein [Paenibacillus phyllosphaerae]